MASIIVKRQLRQVCFWIIELAGEEACEGSLISVFAVGEVSFVWRNVSSHCDTKICGIKSFEKDLDILTVVVGTSTYLCWPGEGNMAACDYLGVWTWPWTWAYAVDSRLPFYVSHRVGTFLLLTPKRCVWYFSSIKKTTIQ
jgi:hypothetical protein